MTHRIKALADRPSRVPTALALLLAMALSVHVLAQEPQPVPDKALREQATKFLGPIVESRPQDRAEAKDKARRLLERTRQVSADADAGLAAAIQYVMLDRARELGEVAGDARSVVQAIDRTSELFDIDAIELKHVGLKNVLAASSDEADHVETTYACLDVCDDMIAADDYERAKDFATLARAAAKRTGVRALDLIAVRVQRDIASLSREFKGLSDAREKLKEAPDDHEANTEIGEYYCLSKENWTRGLPYLAKTDGVRGRASLARMELGEASDDPWKQIDLAERWIEIGKRDRKRGAAMFRHALDLLRRAATRADAVARVRIAALKKDTPVDDELTLSVKVSIDGGDELRISNYDLSWTHKEYGWPSDLRVNDTRWNPESTPSRPLPGRPDGRRLDFEAAMVTKSKARDQVEHRVEGNALVVRFLDAPSGAAEYEIEIVIPRRVR